MLTLYGIPNCDTVKKARAWLAEQGVAHRFHDFKKDGVPAERLGPWLKVAGRDLLVNRKGTTWRKLDPAAQGEAATDAGAAALMAREPSVIKRPVVEWQRPGAPEVSVGFDPEAWAGWLR